MYDGRGGAPDMDEASVFERMVDSVACFERDGTIAYLNPVAGRLLARLPAEVIGQNVWTLVPGARAGPFGAAFDRVVRSGETECFESTDPASGLWVCPPRLPGGRTHLGGRPGHHRAEAGERPPGDPGQRLPRLLRGGRRHVERFEKIARQIAEVMRDLCVIRLLSVDGQHFEAPLGLWDVDLRFRQLLQGTPSVASSEAVGPEILRTGKPIVMANIDPAEVAARIAPSPRRELVEKLGIHSVLVVPLRARGQIQGILSVARRKTGTRAAYTDGDLSLLEELATRAALVVSHWRAFELVEKSREQLRVIGDSVPVLVSLIDPDSRYLFANATYGKWFGEASRTVVGRTMEEVLGPAAYATVSPYVKTALSGQPVNFQTRVRYASGGERHVEAAYTPYRVDGRVEGVVAMVADVSDRVQLEESLRRWEDLFQHAGWGVAMMHPQTSHLLAVNPAFARMHGYPVDELLARPLADACAPESRDALPAHLAAAQEKGQHQFESFHLRQDGSRFPCLTEITTFRGPGGEIAHCAANFQDITERQRHETELRAAVAIRNEFLSIASHELRTPLAALQLQLEGLQRLFTRGLEEGDRHKPLRRMGLALRQVERLTALVEALLNVSRISTGRLRLETEAFDLVALIARGRRAVRRVGQPDRFDHHPAGPARGQRPVGPPPPGPGADQPAVQRPQIRPWQADRGDPPGRGRSRSRSRCATRASASPPRTASASSIPSSAPSPPATTAASASASTSPARWSAPTAAPSPSAATPARAPPSPSPSLTPKRPREGGRADQVLGGCGRV